MRRLLAAALLLLPASILPPAAHAEDGTGRTIIVMDGSGSMWGQIDGVPKLEIARKAVADILGRIDPSRELGLVAYGHRRRGDCSDIEVMVEPAAGTASRVLDAVNAMRFQGRTPLSEAVRHAANALRFTENPATVVLVTDGLETCEADPCALGAELESAGIDFTAHVVGFGLSREEGAQVSCLAENTGGRYIQASDAADLAEALTETVLAPALPDPEARAEQEPEAEPAAPPATLTAEASGTVTSGLPVSWDGPGAEDDYVDIVPASEPNGRAIGWVYTRDGNPVTLKLPAKPGDYLLRYRWTGGKVDKTLASRPITVADAEFALDAPQSAEQGALITVHWRGPANDDDYVDTIGAGETRTSNEITYSWVRDGNPATVQVPLAPGKYDLRYVVQGPTDRSVGLSVPLTVTPSTADLIAPPAVRPGAEIPIRFEGPAAPNDWVDLVTPGFTEFSGEITYFYTRDAKENEDTLTAPQEAGDYELRYVVEGNDGRLVLVRRALAVSPDAPAETPLPDRDEAPAQ